ncbi:MAG: methylated-DNA--[protein]-cysteine S-methyltransferase [Bacteroidales bacterium]|nr:methylated-DNA--[protein]-cysteine S-methyltransferase [Bacteroidales bacterium]
MYSEQSIVDYRRVEAAIGFIREHRMQQPSLEEISEHVHLSPYHFQRMFTRWAGVSPKKFLQYLTIRYARERLANNPPLSEIAYDAGLSGAGRLHELFITIEGMTPDQYRKSGAGLSIWYGLHYSPFGKYLLAITRENKICTLQFIEDDSTAISTLKQQWGSSSLIHDQGRTGPVASGLFQTASSGLQALLVRGTSFQLKVWEALLRIPFGEVVTYQEIAAHINNPKGLQAVGSAIGKNPIAYLIPCHRVIKKTGQISEYRWGSQRKSAILGWEAARE